MRIKYFILGSQDSNSGVAKKLFSQVSELHQLGLDAELVLVIIGDAHYPPCSFLKTYRLDNVPMDDFFGRIKRTRKISKVFSETIDSLGSDDILYYRCSNSLPIFYPYNYFRRFRACRIVTEHQTKELDEFKLVGSILNYWSDYFIGKLLRKQSDAIIGVTDEITQYEISRSGDPDKPHITIGNGFAVQSVPVRQAPHFAGDELHVLFVANVSRWHGIDRLLQGLAIYDGIQKIVLHVAGDGAELPRLQKLADDLGISDRIVFYGFINGKDLDVLFDKCHVAVGSIGIHRKGLRQTSELKGREYCARGIPYIIACADPDFPADFPYILCLPADESPIDVKRVLAFAEEICADPRHPEKMRLYAEEHLDWSVKMRKLKGFLKMLVGVCEDDSALELGESLLIGKDIRGDDTASSDTGRERCLWGQGEKGMPGKSNLIK